KLPQQDAAVRLSHHRRRGHRFDRFRRAWTPGAATGSGGGKRMTAISGQQVQQSLPASTMTHLQCTYCGTEYEADTLQTLCPKDGRGLAPRYDLARAARTMTKEALATRPATRWRYSEIMPCREPEQIVSLGEGWTPLLPVPGFASLT